MGTKGEGCGIYPFLIKKSIFLRACIGHDAEFVVKEMGFQHKTRKQVDREFLARMLSYSLNWREKAQAYLFYGLARSLGWIWW